VRAADTQVRELRRLLFESFTTRRESPRGGLAQSRAFFLRPPFVVSGTPDKELLEFPEKR